MSESLILKEICEAKFYASAYKDYMEAVSERYSKISAALTMVVGDTSEREEDETVDQYVTRVVNNAVQELGIEDRTNELIQVTDTGWTTVGELLRSACATSEAAASGAMSYASEPSDATVEQLAHMCEVHQSDWIVGTSDAQSERLNPLVLIDTVNNTLQAVISSAAALAASTVDSVGERITTYTNYIRQRFTDVYTTISNTGTYFMNVLTEQSSSIADRVSSIIGSFGASERAQSTSTDLNTGDLRRFTGASPMPAIDGAAIKKVAVTTGRVVAAIAAGVVGAVGKLAKMLFKKAKRALQLVTNGKPIDIINSDPDSTLSVDGWAFQDTGSFGVNYQFYKSSESETISTAVLGEMNDWITSHAGKWLKFSTIFGELLFKYEDGWATPWTSDSPYGIAAACAYSNATVQWKPHAINAANLIEAITQVDPNALASKLPTDGYSDYGTNFIRIPADSTDPDTYPATTRLFALPFSGFYQWQVFTTRLENTIAVLKRFKELGYRASTAADEDNVGAEYCEIQSGLLCSTNLIMPLLLIADEEVNPSGYFFSRGLIGTDYPDGPIDIYRARGWGPQFITRNDIPMYPCDLALGPILPLAHKQSGSAPYPTNADVISAASGWDMTLPDVDEPATFRWASMQHFGFIGDPAYLASHYRTVDDGLLSTEQLNYLATAIENRINGFLDDYHAWYRYWIMRVSSSLISQIGAFRKNRYPTFVPYRDNVAGFYDSALSVRTDEANQAALTTFITVAVVVAVVVIVAVTAGVLISRWLRQREFDRTQFVGEMDNKMWNGGSLTPSEQRKYLRYKRKGLAGDSVSGGQQSSGSSVISKLFGALTSEGDSPDAQLIATNDNSRVISILKSF